MCAEAGVTSPAQTAKEIFTGMPDEVKLAAVIAGVSMVALENATGTQAQALSNWAEGVLQAYTKQG